MRLFGSGHDPVKLFLNKIVNFWIYWKNGMAYPALSVRLLRNILHPPNYTANTKQVLNNIFLPDSSKDNISFIQ